MNANGHLGGGRGGPRAQGWLEHATTSAVRDKRIAERFEKAPPSEGGWNMYVSANYTIEHGPTHKLLRSKGELPLNGWSSSPAVEAEVEAWYDAKSLDEEKEIARRLNKAAFDHVPYAPLGRFMMQMGWRKSLAGMAPAPIPFPWGVSKTA